MPGVYLIQLMTAAFCVMLSQIIIPTVVGSVEGDSETVKDRMRDLAGYAQRGLSFDLSQSLERSHAALEISPYACYYTTTLSPCSYGDTFVGSDPRGRKKA